MTCWLCGFETTELFTNTKAPICKNGPCQICIAVGKVDDEINQAVATLRRLLSKRCDLRSEQNRAHGTLIHRLPAELKNYIFQLFLPLRDQWGESSRIGGQSKNLMPLYLASSVCRGWRDIAWSNPSLWSTMDVTLGARFPTGPSSRINFVQNWLLRSRPMPLTIRIRVHKMEDLGQEELKEVTDAISQWSHRWQSLSLDMPLRLLRAFLHNNPQYHLLRRLKLTVGARWKEKNDDFKPLLNPTASPEKIEISGISLQSLQISWNNLSSAKLRGSTLEEIMQLFQHASQMTRCLIRGFVPDTRNFSMPPIIHRRLKTLTLYHIGWDVEAMLFGSLTLPSLQEFHTDKIHSLIPAHLPALVHRSSCPLTRITFLRTYGVESGFFDIMKALKPLPGVTDLVLANPNFNSRDAAIVRNVDEYFPDLRHLTLRLKPFLSMWCDDIPMLLDRNRTRPESPNGGNLAILVVDKDRAQFDDMWNSEVGEELKAWNISLKKNYWAPKLESR